MPNYMTIAFYVGNYMMSKKWIVFVLGYTTENSFPRIKSKLHGFMFRATDTVVERWNIAWPENKTSN